MNIFDWNARLDKEVASNSLYSWVAKTKGIDAARAMAASAIRNRFDKRYGAGPAAKIPSPDKMPEGYKIPSDTLRARVGLSVAVNRVVNSASNFRNITKGVLAGSPAYLKYKQEQERIQAEQERTQSFFGKLFRYDAIAKSAKDSASVFYRGAAKQRLASATSAPQKAYLFGQRLNALFRFNSPSKSAKASASVFQQAIANGYLNTLNKKQQTTITKGVQTALGGKNLHTLQRAMFGGTTAALIKAAPYIGVAKLAWDLSMGLAMKRGASSQQTGLLARGVGVSHTALRGLGNIAKIYGGSEGDAASIFGSLHDFRIGSRYGYGFGQLENLYRFGVRFHPGMSDKEILAAIADRYSALGTEDRAYMARTAGIPAPLLKPMEGGGKSFLVEIERMEKEAAEKLAELEKIEETKRILYVKLTNLADGFATHALPVFEKLHGWFSKKDTPPNPLEFEEPSFDPDSPMGKHQALIREYYSNPANTSSPTAFPVSIFENASFTGMTLEQVHEIAEKIREDVKSIPGVEMKMPGFSSNIENSLLY